MKRSRMVFVAALLLPAFFHVAAFAAEATAPEPRKRTPDEEKKLAEMKKRSSELRKNLNGSSWEVSYVSSSDPKLKGKKDTFVFQNGVFTSQAFTKRGFSSTNYTISVSPDETSKTGVWETMQTGKDGQIFVRGEWEGERMSGNITEQLDGGKKVFDHSFTTTSRKAIPPSTEEAAEEQSSQEEAKSSHGGGALVSKEKAEEVTPFMPGTTDETH